MVILHKNSIDFATRTAKNKKKLFQASHNKRKKTSTNVANCGEPRCQNELYKLSIYLIEKKLKERLVNKSY